MAFLLLELVKNPTEQYKLLKELLDMKDEGKKTRVMGLFSHLASSRDSIQGYKDLSYEESKISIRVHAWVLVQLSLGHSFRRITVGAVKPV
jgi:hypothetical protein